MSKLAGFKSCDGPRTSQGGIGAVSAPGQKRRGAWCLRSFFMGGQDGLAHSVHDRVGVAKSSPGEQHQHVTFDLHRVSPGTRGARTEKRSHGNAARQYCMVSEGR